MKILEGLQTWDPAVKRMTEVYLLDKAAPYTTEGWIDRFLSYFNEEEKTWGGGIYSPKWISTFYTLRDLQSLEIDPKHPVFQQGLETLVTNMWNPEGTVEKDDCVVAMLISLLAYGGYPERVIDEMAEYLITRQMSDGGWNCRNNHRGTKNSSIHTTLSVLEAYRDYHKQGYSPSEKVMKAMEEQSEEGREYLLRKQLMRRESDGEIILPYITVFHFPTRWKYDVLRALSYFASIQHPYDPRMEEALGLLQRKIKKGYLTRGTTYSGQLHFKMESTGIGSMNTLRGLRVLKHYDPQYYRHVIGLDIPM